MSNIETSNGKSVEKEIRRLCKELSYPEGKGYTRAYLIIKETAASCQEDYMESKYPANADRSKPSFPSDPSHSDVQGCVLEYLEQHSTFWDDTNDARDRHYLTLPDDEQKIKDFLAQLMCQLAQCRPKNRKSKSTLQSDTLNSKNIAPEEPNVSAPVSTANLQQKRTRSDQLDRDDDNLPSSPIDTPVDKKKKTERMPVSQKGNRRPRQQRPATARAKKQRNSNSGKESAPKPLKTGKRSTITKTVGPRWVPDTTPLEDMQRLSANTFVRHDPPHSSCQESGSLSRHLNGEEAHNNTELGANPSADKPTPVCVGTIDSRTMTGLTTGYRDKSGFEVLDSDQCQQFLRNPRGRGFFLLKTPHENRHSNADLDDLHDLGGAQTNNYSGDVAILSDMAENLCTNADPREDSTHDTEKADGEDDLEGQGIEESTSYLNTECSLQYCGERGGSPEDLISCYEHPLESVESATESVLPQDYRGFKVEPNPKPQSTVSFVVDKHGGVPDLNRPIPSMEVVSASFKDILEKVSSRRTAATSPESISRLEFILDWAQGEKFIIEKGCSENQWEELKETLQLIVKFHKNFLGSKVKKMVIYIMVGVEGEVAKVEEDYW